MTLGVPVMAPIVVLKERPVGRVGEMLKLRVPVPPPAVTGVKLLTAWFWVRNLLAIDCVAVTALFTVSVKLFDAVAPLASVAVTV